MQKMFTVDGELRVPPIHACLPPNSNDFTMHFSFDMAQQVWLELYKIQHNLMHMHMYVPNRCTIPATPNSLVLSIF